MNDYISRTLNGVCHGKVAPRAADFAGIADLSTHLGSALPMHGSVRVGGGATVEMVENGFRILMSDPGVKAVLINIFGGILRCDTLAKGVLEAVSKVKVNVPVVVRLEGTNVEEGRRILNSSGFRFIVANGMKEAAEKVVAALK